VCTRVWTRGVRTLDLLNAMPCLESEEESAPIHAYALRLTLQHSGSLRIKFSDEASDL